MIAKITKRQMYKGFELVTFEDFMGLVYTLNASEGAVYHSAADAKRALRGEPLTYNPLPIYNERMQALIADVCAQIGMKKQTITSRAGKPLALHKTKQL